MRSSLMSKLAFFFPCLALCQVNILTYRYDKYRTGANLNETVLTSDVVKNNFGKLFTLNVGGLVYAQPLYVSGVTIPGKGVHNVLYVATMEDVLFAFDADNGAVLWSHVLATPNTSIAPVPVTDITGGGNIVGDVGIEGTPVIDPASNTIYLVARTKENGQYFQRLHAMDITSGAERANSPVTIAAVANGNGTTSVSGRITFDPLIHNQRPGLALASNRIFIAWASHGDTHAYHGWVMAYDAVSLALVSAVNITANGAQGGIWQSGWAPAVDDTNHVYYISGNGDWDGVKNFGESFLKFTTSEKVAVVDYFAPDNLASLNNTDEDLGGSGAMLIPGANVVIGGGKQGLLYVLNANNLGHFSAGNAHALQVLPLNADDIKGGPVYWKRATNPLVFVQAETDFPRAFQFNGTTLTGPVLTGTSKAPRSGGGILAFSADSNGASAILWSSTTISQGAGSGLAPGLLRAYDANNGLVELWDSEANSARDSLGNWAKFVPPVVANGKVYMASFSNTISVYGRLK